MINHPKEYQICTKCVMDTSDLEIAFDSDGICNHCRQVDIQKSIYWQPNNPKLLEKKLEEIRKNGQGKKYDCIIGLSGGVDSSYLAHLVVKKWKLRALAIHVDAGWNSEIAVRNIEYLVRGLNLDFYCEVLNWPEVQDLQRAYFLSGVENLDVPQDHAFFSVLYNKIREHSVCYFLTGGNMATESILPSSWGYDAMDSSNLLDIHRRFGTVPLKTYPVYPLIQRYFIDKFVSRLSVPRLLDFLPYDRDRAIQLLEKSYGWCNYGGKHHESRWTKWFQAHYLPTKFNIDKRRAHLSSMINSGNISRNMALDELKKPLYDENDLRIDTKYVMKKINVSLDQYNHIMESPPKHFSDYKNNYWIRKLIGLVRK